MANSRGQNKLNLIFSPDYDEAYNEIRTLIIGHALYYRQYDGYCKFSCKLIQNCRRVCKDWLKITSKVLLRNCQPLFHLTLDKNWFLLNQNYYHGIQRRKSILDFGNLVGGRPAPIALRVSPEYFQNFTQHEILNIWNTFNNVLVRIDMTINQKNAQQGKLFCFSLQRILLPRLKTFKVQFTKDDPAVNFQLAPVFRAAPNLLKLGLPCGDKVFVNFVLPRDLASIVLPAELTALDLSTKLESRHLRVLANSPLPNLRRLTLLVHRDPFENGLVFQVLENVRFSLEHLFVQGEGHDGSPEPPTYFSLPVMGKLSELEFESQHFELETATNRLGECLPKLRKLRLMIQTQQMLDKWINSDSKIESTLKRLYVTMTDENFADDNRAYHVTLGAENMRRLSKTFPNVKEFWVDFRQDKDNLGCLAVVFSEMTSIEKLKLIISTKTLLWEDKWTSALLAVPIKKVPDLKKKKISLYPNHPTETISIRNLKNLHTLKVDLDRVRLPTGEKILSDLVFKEAFLRMPRLKNLILTSKMASTEVLNSWLDKGRQLTIFQDESDDDDWSMQGNVSS